MSFLLLKSKSRSNRSTSYRSKRNNNNDRNPSIAPTSRNNSNSTGNRFSNPKQINAGGGQVQLQRPQRQQMRQINHRQGQVPQQQQQKPQQQQNQQQKQQQNQQQSQQQNANDVISMDDVMEDLRVLEQQQRDSQRHLASIKLTKQHKLEQRVSLETKLSSLKYSNGEARAQLLRARDVLSKSTRELGSARLSSERSSDNLKRFDDKLKRTLGHIRGLHAKRRQVEQAIVKLRNADAIFSQEQRGMSEQLKNKEMERDDAKHREKLLIKSIQSSKMKAQELVEDTMQMRSDLSELEGDLTIAQQMEASTKFRADSLNTEIHTEQKRHKEAKLVIEARIEDMKGKEMEIEKKIHHSKVNIEATNNKLNEAFNECVQYQKEDGLELSTSPKSAAIDIERIRGIVADEESNLRVVEQEEISIVEKVKDLERLILEVKEQNRNLEMQSDKIANDVIKEREIEEKRGVAHDTFMAEFNKEKAAVEELRSTTTQFQEEQVKDQNTAIEIEKEQQTEILNIKKNLQSIENEVRLIEEDNELCKMNSDDEKIANKAKIDKAKQLAREKKTEFDTIQKEADDIASTDVNDNIEIINIVNGGKQILDETEQERSRLLEDHPCLASLDIVYNENERDEDQIEAALSDLRAACEARINAVYEEEERLREEARIKAAKEEEDRLIREATELARIESEEKERLLEEARVIAAKEEKDRLAREAEAEELARIELEKEEEEKRLLEEARVIAAKEEEDRLAREAEAEELAEKARQEAEERARNQALLEEKARKKAEALERAHSKALAEKKARKQAEAEERARNQALVEEKARKKAEAQRRVRSKALADEKAKKEAEERARNQALVEEKAKRKAEALELARSEALSEEKARKRARLLEERQRKKADTEKRAKERSRKKRAEEERKKAEAKVKAKLEAKAKMKAEAKAKAKPELNAEVEKKSNRSQMITSQSRKSNSSTTPKLVRAKRGVSEIEQRSTSRNEDDPSSHSLKKKKNLSSRTSSLKENTSSREQISSKKVGNRLSQRENKSSSSQRKVPTDSVTKKRRASDERTTTSTVEKRSLSQTRRSGKRDTNTEKSRLNHSKVSKLDIFSSNDLAPSKKTSSSASRSTLKRKESTRTSKTSQDTSKRTKTQKSRMPSQSQATAASRKSASSTRRRKKATATTGKTKSSQSGSMDMDFSFM